VRPCKKLDSQRISFIAVLASPPMDHIG
jgi:hypothetical protein